MYFHSENGKACVGISFCHLKKNVLDMVSNLDIFCNVYFYDRDSSSGLKHQPQQNWLDGGNILTATQYKDAET